MAAPPGAEATVAQQHSGVGQQPFADANVVAVGGRHNRNTNHAGHFHVGFERLQHQIDDGCRIAPGRVDLLRDGGVGMATLVEQIADTAPLLVRVIRQQWPVDHAFEAAQNLVKRGRQADERAARGQRGTIARIDQGAAAGADDQTLLLAKAGADLAFSHAKGGLAFVRKDLGDGLAEMGFDLGIDVDEGAIKAFGQQQTDSGLAGAHETGEHNVALGGKIDW